MAPQKRKGAPLDGSTEHQRPTKSRRVGSERGWVPSLVDDPEKILRDARAAKAQERAAKAQAEKATAQDKRISQLERNVEILEFSLANAQEGWKGCAEELDQCREHGRRLKDDVDILKTYQDDFKEAWIECGKELDQCQEHGRRLKAENEYLRLQLWQAETQRDRECEEKLDQCREHAKGLETDNKDLREKLEASKLPSKLPSPSPAPLPSKAPSAAPSLSLSSSSSESSSESPSRSWAQKFDDGMEAVRREGALQRFKFEVVAGIDTYQEPMVHAIASVTEAHGRRSHPFAVATQVALDTAKEPSLPAEGLVLARPENILLWPLVDDGHNVLLAFDKKDDGKAQMTWFDSKPNCLMDQRERIWDELRGALRRLSWGRPLFNDGAPLPELEDTVVDMDVPGQLGRNCGLHTIVNAWVLALGLEFNPALTEVTPEFARDATDIINGAMRGLVDCDTIYAFLMKHEYVIPASIPDECRFERTREITRPSHMMDLVEEAVLAQSQG